MHLQALYPDSRSVLVPVIVSHNQSDCHELSKTISRLDCVSVRLDLAGHTVTFIKIEHSSNYAHFWT